MPGGHHRPSGRRRPAPQPRITIPAGGTPPTGAGAADLDRVAETYRKQLSIKSADTRVEVGKLSGGNQQKVMLAKWLLEHDPDGRVLIITDRDELDKQISGVMRNAGVISADSASPRITSRAQFLQILAAPSPRLLCALLHKFEPDLMRW